MIRIVQIFFILLDNYMIYRYTGTCTLQSLQWIRQVDVIYRPRSGPAGTKLRGHLWNQQVTCKSALILFICYLV